MRAAISRALGASSVTTSLPSALVAWTSAPDRPPIAWATRCALSGRACTTIPAMCSSLPTGGRTADDLEYPHQEAVRRDDDAREHRRHHDGEKQEAAQLLVPGVLHMFTIRRRQKSLPLPVVQPYQPVRQPLWVRTIFHTCA